MNQPRYHLLLIVAVLLLAAALRILAICDAPPGPRFDETYEALWARRVMNGEWPIYFPENFGAEALNAYFQAASLAALGWSDFALRFPSILFGMVEVSAVYALGRRAWNRRAGLLAAALCAVSFWAVFFARLGMRLIPLTAFVSLGIWRLFEMRASPTRQVWGRGIAAGILLGLSVHTYTAARALPVWLIGALVYLALFHRAELRRQIAGWVLTLVVAALIAAPLVYYLATQPQAEARVEQVSGPLDALRQGDVAPLLEYTLAALGMFVLRGGTEWLYNLPGRPIFDPLTALAFLTGVVVALRHWRESRTALVLIWLAVGLAPILLSWPPASTSHAILAQPAVYLIAGLGLDTIFSFIAKNGWLRSWLSTVLALGLLSLNVTLTARDYFGAWNASDQVRWEHQATVTAMGRYADAHPEWRDVAFMGNAVDHYDPWMKVGNSLTARRTDVRWFNPARALVWNPTRPMTYFVPFRDPNPITFNQVVRDLFFGAATQTIEERLPDGRPVFTAYVITDARTLAMQAVAGGARPYDFDGRLALIGYEVRPNPARPGESIRVLTIWRVLRADPGALVMFAHLVGPDGKRVTQEDRLDVAPETLQAGDEFLQTHRLTLPGDLSPGAYRVWVGMYSPLTQGRLPVAGSDRVEFSLGVE